MSEVEGLVYEYDPRPISAADIAHEEALWEKFRREGGPIYNLRGEVVGHAGPSQRVDDDEWSSFLIPLPPSTAAPEDEP